MWESGILFGVGVVSGAILFRGLQKALIHWFNKDGVQRVIMVGTTERAERLNEIRAKGLGRTHKMIFVVRTDLGMGKGEIASQCCHAAVLCYQKAMIMDSDNLDIWEATGNAKICLQTNGDDKTLLALEQRARSVKIVTGIVKDFATTGPKPVYL